VMRLRPNKKTSRGIDVAQPPQTRIEAYYKAQT